MSYQKPEKDFGEGPVRFFPSLDCGLHEAYIAHVVFFFTTENPQDPHHPDIAQNPEPRKGLPGAHRACEEQGPPRQGSCPSPNQESEDHHEEDALR